MQAKERRSRHFRSSIGSMLNENYNRGIAPDITITTDDFDYRPKLSLPMSKSALNFLQHKFPERRGSRPRLTENPSPSDSLFQAHVKAVTQPEMMVHYDRDPLYKASRKTLEGGGDQWREDVTQPLDEINCRRQAGVPSDVSAASTPPAPSTANSSKVNGGAMPTKPVKDFSEIRAKARSSSSDARIPSVRDLKLRSSAGGLLERHALETPNKPMEAEFLQKLPTGKMEDNRHRLWTPGSEAAGLKPYTPFSDSLFDFGKKEAKFIPPELPEEMMRTREQIAAPRYHDAYVKMLDLEPADSDGRPVSVNVLKVHGNPQYPEKVMDDKDVPNYVAWAAIYPYCPLTQIEGKDKPEYVPPRGFTPSTASVSSRHTSATKLKVNAKRDILAGMKPPSAAKSTRSSVSSCGRKNRLEAARPENFQQPFLAPRPLSMNTKILLHQQKLQDKNCKSMEQQHGIKPRKDQVENLGQTNLQNKVNDNLNESSALNRPPSKGFDLSVPRRVLEMKMKCPDVWYTGRTPSHTPTPDYTLPVKPSKAWINHYSPQRVRHFLRGINGEPSSGTPVA